MTTISDVRRTVQDIINDVVHDYGNTDTDRETVIERLDEECDTAFGQLVYMGPISEWTSDVLVNHAADCDAIIKTAERDAWVEDDSGLWEGLTFGLIGAIAFFSLRNLLYAALKAEGYDTNEDEPFANKELATA